MKHVKKKFIRQINIEKGTANELVRSNKNVVIPDNINFENYVPHAISDSDLVIQSFFYELNGNRTTIYEPNPIVIYFHSGQSLLAECDRLRKELFIEITPPNPPDFGKVLNQMFGFYYCASNIISSFFCSMEAFMNSKINEAMEEDFKIDIQASGAKISYDKKKILREMSFLDKIKIIMPKICSKNFAQKQSHIYADIKELKRFRDNIIHAKPNLKFEVNYYDELYTQALNFDYFKIAESVKSFINFYEPNLIEQCDCGNNY
jgi:hypothetical protein